MTFTNFQTEEELKSATEEFTLRRYYVGLDLGQTTDPTAMSVIEKRQVPILHLGHRTGKLNYVTAYGIRHLERLPLGTSYPAVIQHVKATLNTVPLTRNSRLIIDHTGVGRPIFDLFQQAHMNPAGITITAGLDWSRESGEQYRVPKGILVSKLQAAIHTGLLKAATGLPEAEVLKGELADFNVTHTQTGHAQFGARTGRHDDLVLSVSVAFWYAATIGNQHMQKVRGRL